MDQGPPVDRRAEALGDLRILPDEIICSILELLSPTDLGRLASVSSVMYIFCNEEPLWMNKCLSIGGPLEYRGSWKNTTLFRQNLCAENKDMSDKPRQFDGFFSMFLYKRWYRCHTSLISFSFETEELERKEDVSLDEFSLKYDGKKPILLKGLAENWAGRNKWTIEQLVLNHGDVVFKISQRSPKKNLMKLKDYVSYMQVQHDEDPLYIFDDKFGEAAPALLEEYKVPDLFKDDFFDILNHEQRPPFRWLIIGPERSGASWHVDPGLTSAWNTLLCGRKRWALYPPGRVPAGVTVHVNEEDGDVNIETPTSLQWWLEIYPQLSQEDKPIECTQLPGETIFVPTGWWHCVLNLETTVAVTQNYVNKSNFEFVCLDLAPGHRHKGVSRAGLLAVPDDEIDNILNNDDVAQKEKRRKCPNSEVDVSRKEKRRKCPLGISDEIGDYQAFSFSYDVDFLARFLEKDRDHYCSAWSPNIYIGQREMRGWLQKLWIAKPEIRDMIWKGACLAINVDKWYQCLLEVCTSHNLPAPSNDEKLPVGTGSNPVFVVFDNVVKIFAEGGFESAIHGLGTELEFYENLKKSGSPLIEDIPEIVASGFLILENGSTKAIAWDGKGVPDPISELYPGAIGDISEDSFSFGVWKKMQFVLQGCSGSLGTILPYLVTKRCRGEIFAHIRDKLSKDNVMILASYLGVQLRRLHELPLPVMNRINLHKTPQESEFLHGFKITPEWEVFANFLHERKRNVKTRLEQWGDPIPAALIEKAEDYLPHNVNFLLDLVKDKNGSYTVSSSPSWIHSDVMDDNILMEPVSINDINAQNNNSTINGNIDISVGYNKWTPTHIIDFSDLSIGDPLLDLIPLHLDIFRGDKSLLKTFLESYALPFSRSKDHNPPEEESKFRRISYCAMCYCILHDENVLGAIFSLHEELKTAACWEYVEELLWGELNEYQNSL